MINIIKYKNLLIAAGIITSLCSVNTLRCEAVWQQDSNGWWNTDGVNSYSVGWKYINDEWYYFGNDGYMKTGWVLSNNTWYYLYENGAMAKDTCIGEYVLDSTGAWLPGVTPADIEAKKQAEEAKKYMIKDSSNMDALVETLNSKGYKTEVKDLDKISFDYKFEELPCKFISINDESLVIYFFDDNNAMENFSKSIDSDGFGYTVNDKETSSEYNMTWTSYPHFYKHNNIIVQYSGVNKTLMKDLEDILGKQFAGIIPENIPEGTPATRKEIVTKIYNNLSYEEQKSIKTFNNIDLKLSRLEEFDSDDKTLSKESYPLQLEYSLIFNPENMELREGITARVDTFKKINSFAICID